MKAITVHDKEELIQGRYNRVATVFAVCIFSFRVLKLMNANIETGMT